MQIDAYITILILDMIFLFLFLINVQPAPLFNREYVCGSLV